MRTEQTVVIFFFTCSSLQLFSFLASLAFMGCNLIVVVWSQRSHHPHVRWDEAAQEKLR